MAEAKPSVADEIERYLRTGESDPYYSAWSGGFMECAQQAHEDLRGALIQEVHRLAEGGSHPLVPDMDMTAFTRGKVGPMVRGLFQRAEQDVVLGLLEKSVVFLTRETIGPVLANQAYGRSAWDLANLYLASIGAELLDQSAPRLQGISEGTMSYVSPEYFIEEDPFSDFIVHETAHIFHNCKRATIDLRETRSKEWLLDIEFRKRETFAYSCEAYSRIVERATSPTERRREAKEYAGVVRIADERVDPAEVAEIVQAAAAARNGWKVILERCAPTRRLRT